MFSLGQIFSFMISIAVVLEPQAHAVSLDSCRSVLLPGALGADSETSLVVAYDELISSPTGSKSEISTESGRFEVYSQIEEELRFFFQSSESPQQLAAGLLRNFYFDQYRDAMARGLKLETKFEDRNFSLRPLTSYFEEFHESGRDQGLSLTTGLRNSRAWGLMPAALKRSIQSWILGDRHMGEMVVELPASRINLAATGNGDGEVIGKRNVSYLEAKHLVGWRSETGIYFDTDDEALQKAGIAVRLKYWTRPGVKSLSDSALPASAEIAASAKAVLTIKKNLGETHGFTSREETQIEWPASLPIDRLPVVAGKLLIDRFGFSETHLKSLRPKFRVNNDRMAVNIFWRNPVLGAGASEKIGFLTMDKFNVYELESGRILTDHPGRQIEIEILPEWQSTILDSLKNREDLQNFTLSIQNFLKGTHSLVPKYLYRGSDNLVSP